MNVRKLVFGLCMALTSYTKAQPSTEVYLCKLSFAGDEISVADPVNVSQNSGYDNQPSFSSDGKFLYYTSWQDDSQTDIIQYDLATQEKARISKSDGSEYSPLETPRGKSISTIILERDGKQLLWEYNLKSGNRKVLVENLTIGYHCWFNKKELFSFVLGAPPSLYRTNVKNGQSNRVDEKIGRSLHKIPNENAISYVSKKKDQWEILRYDVKNGEITKIADCLPGVEDLCWTPNGRILMGKESILYTFSSEKEWVEIADLSKFGLQGISRLSVNPGGRLLALVVTEPDKEN